ncbi:MAG: hypothetical protein AB8B83_06520 [Bdellovibrionales bacterium]
MIIKILLASFLLASVFTPTPSHAQTDIMQPPLVQQNQVQQNNAVANSQQVKAQNAQPNQTKNLRKFDADSFPSLLFTYWEQIAIEDAKRSVGENRAPTAAELQEALTTEIEDERVRPPPEERDIKLSGIAYKGFKNWTIWLNGKRVTPNAIPKEAIDLKVFKEYIEIKWFDEYTNQIIPIRLRAHQRFNIDNKMFLPG